MNLSELWKNTWFKVATVAVAVLLVAVGAWAALGASGNGPTWLPAFPGASDSRSAESTGAAKPDGTADKATATVTPAADGSADDSKDKPGTDSPADKPGTDSKTDTGTQQPAAKTISIMILLWNDTEQKAPKNLEVAVGDIKWVLGDPSAKSATGELKGLIVGKDYQLEVYPDGRGGNKILVPISFTADMRSGSEADAIHVEVRDEQIRVLGTPVDNFDLSADRFK